MRTIITYVAEDGKQFRDEDECLAYETELRNAKFAANITFFDSDGKTLSLSEDGFLSAKFILCRTKEATQFLQDEYGPNYYTPWDDNPIEAGCWVKDDLFDDNNWRPVEDYVDDLKNNLNVVYRIILGKEVSE